MKGVYSFIHSILIQVIRESHELSAWQRRFQIYIIYQYLTFIVPHETIHKRYDILSRITRMVNDFARTYLKFAIKYMKSDYTILKIIEFKLEDIM